jgi:hypothetical protein
MADTAKDLTDGGTRRYSGFLSMAAPEDLVAGVVHAWSALPMEFNFVAS